MKRITIKAKESSVSQVLDLIEEELKKYGCKKKEIVQAMLISEECIVGMIHHTSPDDDIIIGIQKSFGKIVLSAEASGTNIDVDSIYNSMTLSDLDEVDEKTEFAIRSILIRNNSDRIRYSRKANTNYLKITLKSDTNFQTKLTIGALLLAIAVGLGLKFLIPNIGTVINDYFFSPVSSIFMRCMKCIVGPIVFISILNSIIGFDDMKVLGKIGAKTMLFYTMTSIIAIAVGFGCFYLFDPGEFGSLTLTTGGGTVEDAVSPSIIDTIVNFFSQNVIVSFFNNDTIQIIVISLFCGIALNKMGERNAPIRSGVESLNEMITMIATAISRIIPLVVFCSISTMMFTMNLASMKSLLFMAVTSIAAYAIMCVVYCILILIFGKVNPLVMLKKYLGTALTVFTLASSNASIPMNMEFSEKIGVSKKIGSFSIPLGATINMDGACISYIVMTLFIAKMYGYSFTTVGLIQLFIIVFVVSMGTPGIAGGTAAFMIPMLAICGAPAEAALLIVGIDTIIDMFRTALNTTGDQSVTLVVASTEQMLDKDKYYTREN